MSALITPGSLSGVIYAASASRQADAKKASNAKAVDEIGVIEQMSRLKIEKGRLILDPREPSNDPPGLPQTF